MKGVHRAFFTIRVVRPDHNNEWKERSAFFSLLVIGSFTSPTRRKMTIYNNRKKGT